MKNLIKSIKLTLVFCVFLSVCYVLVLWAYAQFAAPGEGGNVETVSSERKSSGSSQRRTAVYPRYLFLGTTFLCR